MKTELHEFYLKENSRNLFAPRICLSSKFLCFGVRLSKTRQYSLGAVRIVDSTWSSGLGAEIFASPKCHIILTSAELNQGNVTDTIYGMHPVIFS